MENTHTHKVKILENHLDTFGHVNNSKYLEIFEQARWEIICDAGWGVDDIKRKGMGPVVLEVYIKFLAEVKNREEVDIISIPASWKGKIGKFKQKMVKSDGSLASEIDLVFGFFDTKERGLVEPPKDWLDLMAGINE